MEALETAGRNAIVARTSRAQELFQNANAAAEYKRTTLPEILTKSDRSLDELVQVRAAVTKMKENVSSAI